MKGSNIQNLVLKDEFILLLLVLELIFHGGVVLVSSFDLRLGAELENTISCLDSLLNSCQSIMEHLHTLLLSAGGGNHQVTWWLVDGDLQFDVLSGTSFSFSESLFNGLDSLWGEAHYLENSDEFNWLGFESSGDFSFELGLDFVANFSQLFENLIWVAKKVKISKCPFPELTECA